VVAVYVLFLNSDYLAFRSYINYIDAIFSEIHTLPIWSLMFSHTSLVLYDITAHIYTCLNALECMLYVCGQFCTKSTAIGLVGTKKNCFQFTF